MNYIQKHTVVPKRDLVLNLDSLSGTVITYTLPDEELSKYRSLQAPDNQSKPTRFGPWKKRAN